MTVHANQKTGLTNGRVENWDWKSGSVLSVRFPIINWRSHSVAKSAWYFVKNGCQTNLIDVLRALFTGTVNKTKWLSQRVLCFGSLFRNYPPYCKSIYMAVLIMSCLFLIYCQTSNRADFMVRTTPSQHWGPQYTGTASVRAWTQEWKDLSSPGLPQATDRSSQ